LTDDEKGNYSFIVSVWGDGYMEKIINRKTCLVTQVLLLLWFLLDMTSRRPGMGVDD